MLIRFEWHFNNLSHLTISNDLSFEVKFQNALAPAEFWSSRVEKVKQVPQTLKVS